MGKRRIQNLELDLEIAEETYREQLITALRRTASGHWGLLGSNQRTEAPDRATAVELLAAGKKIQEIREQLGNTEPFGLHERFVALRRRCRESKVVGEPKLAEHFLAELLSDD